MQDAYSRHRWPVWFSEVSGGRPLLANINVGALYPIRPLLSVLPFPMAMRIYPVLHWWLAAIGAMLLLSTAGASRPAAWIGAATYVFSGVSLSEIFYSNHQPGMSLLPWIVWSVARPSRSLAGRLLLPSLLIGLDLLGGDVFTAGLALVAAVCWILFEKDRSTRPAALASLAICTGLAVLLALPQLLATVLWIPETHRAVSGMRLSEALRFSVSPWRLLELFIPYPFGPTWANEPRATWAPAAFGGLAMGFFATIHAGSFATLAAIATWRRSARGLRFARALALFGIAVCVLPSLAPASWGEWSAPLPLRYPEKMAAALTLAAAFFAGVAFDRLRREGSSRRWPVVVAVALTAAAVAAWLAPHGIGRVAASLFGARSSPSAAAAHLPGALAEAGLLWVAAVVARDCLARPGRAALAAALLLATAAPLAANRRIARSFPEEQIFGPTAFVRALDRADPGRAFRTLGESRYIPPSRFESAQLSSDIAFLDYARRNWLFYTPALWRRGVVLNDDFDAGDLSRVESLRRLSVAAARFRDPPAFFGSLSLRFGIRFPDQPPAPGFLRFGGNAFEAWDENPAAQADVRLLERWREAPDALSALRDIPFLVQGEVALETGSESPRAARSGTLRILEKSPEVLRVETETLDPTFLFVLRGFWSHRSIAVDGRPAAAVPAQLGFSAVAVPAGRHRVDWRERVPGSPVSRWGPMLYAAAALGLWSRGRRRGDSIR